MKLALNLSLSGKDIMRMAKSFEFTNLNYIKKYPDIFENALKENIVQKYKACTVDIKSLISEAERKKLSAVEINLFANMSLRETTIPIPNLLNCFKLKKAMYDLLEKAHADVKVKLAEQRKSEK